MVSDFFEKLDCLFKVSSALQNQTARVGKACGLHRVFGKSAVQRAQQLKHPLSDHLFVDVVHLHVTARHLALVLNHPSDVREVLGDRRIGPAAVDGRHHLDQNLFSILLLNAVTEGSFLCRRRHDNDLDAVDPGHNRFVQAPRALDNERVVER
jgi:hypothetical protein